MNQFAAPVVPAINWFENTGTTLAKGTEMADYEHGSMDTTEQEKTFAGLVKASVWVSVVVILTLIFLAFVGT